MLLKRFKSARIPKLLLTYLVEVIIIFLGITISFLFEQWREEKRQQKALIELSESLLTDIDALKKKLTVDLDGSSKWISQLDSLRIQRISGNVSERHKEIPVVIYSTTKDETEITNLYELGAVDFLAKPNSFEELYRSLNRMINRLRAESC